jgi:hypothetical protein
MHQRFFQRHMSRLLGDCKYNDATPYQDDVNIASETAAEHVVSVANVLDRLEKAGMKLKMTKCRFGKRSIETWVFKVTNGQVTPSDFHKGGMSAFRMPTDGTSILRFLGLVVFFGKFLEQAALKCAPLYAMLDGVPWNRKNRNDKKYTYLGGTANGDPLSNRHSMSRRPSYLTPHSW